MHFKQEHGDEEKMTTMCSYERSDENISIRIDAYYEELAKQEEIYLEEIEEDVRMILEFEDPPPSPPNRVSIKNERRPLKNSSWEILMTLPLARM
jgi:hypothetical protein